MKHRDLSPRWKISSRGNFVTREKFGNPPRQSWIGDWIKSTPPEILLDFAYAVRYYAEHGELPPEVKPIAPPEQSDEYRRGWAECKQAATAKLQKLAADSERTAQHMDGGGGGRKLRRHVHEYRADVFNQAAGSLQSCDPPIQAATTREVMAFFGLDPADF